jgi:hypothetical protein
LGACREWMEAGVDHETSRSSHKKPANSKGVEKH